jgi:hypothetical protein
LERWPVSGRLRKLPAGPGRDSPSLNLDDTSRDLIVRGRVGVVTADWSADGKTLFVTTMDSERKTALFDVKVAFDIEK